MSELLKQLIEQARALSAEEKSLLAERLLQEIEVPDTEWDAAWAAESERRLKSIEDGSATTVPWDEVRKRLSGL